MKRDGTKTSRREFLLAAGGIVGGIALKPATAAAAESTAAMSVAPAATREAIAKVVGSARVNPGKVTLDLPALIENGNAVPLSVKVDSPMTQADHVKAIHVFAPRRTRCQTS